MITTETQVWINGSRECTFDTADRGLAYGDGLFETMRFANGEIALFKLHKQRLLEGCRVLAIAGVERLLADAIAPALQFLRSPSSAGRVYRVKVIVTRGTAGHGFRPDASVSAPTIIVRVTPLAETTENTQGVSLWLCHWRLALTPLIAGIKHLNRLEYVMAAQELADQDLSLQGLLTDTNGSVIEALHHNVFIVKRGELLTPKITMCGVKGVMRRHIIEVMAPALDLHVIEKELRLDDLLNADEIFLSNSVQGIWPVTEFRGKHLPLGPITSQLQTSVEQLWRGGHAG